jgi:mRNA interferase YafQ
VKTLARTNQFRKDYKKAKRRRQDIPKLLEVVSRLASGEKLEPRYRDHTLGGDYSDCRECHIEPDWILIYRLYEDELVLVRTGSHADLFE